MLQSMTGYGEANNGSLHCEIKTLNHRFLNINFNIPSSLSRYEYDIRKVLGSQIKRGAVSLKISIEDSKIKLDIEKAKIYYNFIKNLKQKLNIKSPIPIDPFLNFKKDEIPSWRVLKSVIATALNHLIETRIEEGSKLQADIELRLKKIDKLIKLIKQKTPKQTELIERFKEKLSPFIKEGIDERRLEEELAFSIIKEDINEECVRLATHIEKFKETINIEEPLGKYFIFLIQEMQREANTISSKARDIRISQCVIELKKELENLREQVENIR